jgi:predicted dehydrogenase/threonine dehydrogenase-like Zn-dependent dehydrogenase
MKQVLQDLHTGKTNVVEVPQPQARSGMALVRTAASVVSAGTERMLVEFAGKSLLGKARSRPDLVRQALDKARREGWVTTIEAAFNRLDQPMALGYASAGTIVELGSGLTGLRIGQRVACAGGGHAVHAEYGVIPKNLLASLPDQVDFEVGAFATLGAIALHGFRLSGAVIGERVVVIGLGLLGLLAIQIGRAGGCQVMGIDLDQTRLKFCKDLDIPAISRQDAEEASRNFTQGQGFDAILICADTPSSDPVELAGEIARDRARVVAVGAVGLQIPRKVYYEKELSFINSRSYGPGRYDPAYEEGGHDYPPGYVRWTEGRNMEAFLDLLASKQVEVKALITHRFSIEEAPAAYELITGKTKEPFLGVVLKYAEEPLTENGGGMENTINPLRTKPPILRSANNLESHHNVKQSVRLGVLGAGKFASVVMFPILRRMRGIDLVGIVSASGVSAQHAAQRFGFRYATSDPDRILNDPDIDAIAILTPHNLHALQVMAALKADKHVFCEKPLAIYNPDLDDIEAHLVKMSQAGVKEATTETKDLTLDSPILTVGFNRRFAPLMMQLAGFLAGRREPLVAHYRVNAGYIPLNHWLHDPQLGGGRIIGEGCHFIDTLTFLVGAPPISVTALALPNLGRYSEDNVVLSYAFADGSLGTLTYLANGDKAFPKERLEVFCEGRAAALDDFRALELVNNGQHRVIHSRLHQDKGHRGEWETFIETILTAGQPPIPYDQLVGVTRASFASMQAIRSGGTTVLSSL